MRRLLIATLLLCAARAATPDIRELFEKARMIAASNQNLPEAIRLFGQVVSMARSQRALAAQAQFRQGLLYERLGRRAEAMRAFRAVVNDFSDQGAVAALARAKLPPAVPQVTNRRVWGGGDVDTTGGISPDGRLLSFTDWSTGDLMVHDFQTGENRRLTRNTAFTRPDFQFAGSSVFSQDGQWIAYTWQPPGDDLPPMELRVIRLDGSGQRTVFRDTGRNWLTVNGWSSDGKYILAAQVGPPTQLLLISLADGTSRAIRVSQRWSGMRLALSGDDRYIAYDAWRGEMSTGPEIHIISTADGADIALLANPSQDSVLGWSPEGEKLVFRSTRSGAPDIWSVSVRNGKASGRPERLKSNVEPTLAPLGITRQGSLYYAVDNGTSDVFIANLHPVSRKLSPPRVLSEVFVGSKRAPAWSPDGSTVAYAARNILGLHIISTGVDRQIHPGLAQMVRVLEWHPDGRSVFVQGFDTHQVGGTFRIDIDTGEASLVLPGIVDREAFSRDGNTVYMWGGQEEQRSIVSQNLLSGEKKVLYTRAVSHEIQNPSLSLSPDGQVLAFQLQNVPRGFNSLALMPVAGGEPRILLQIREPERFGANTFAWSPDMRSIYAARNLNNHSEIWRVPVDGDPAEPAGISMAGVIRQLHLSPDGRQFVFATFRSADEVWVLENFLPSVSPARPARRW